MRPLRPLAILALLALLLGGPLAAPPRPAAAQDSACFPETGFCVRDRFLDYWQANGGLARNGFPLTDERQEVLEDGQTYTVQYFERVRLEYHPENPAPYDILLGQFGRSALATADFLTGRFGTLYLTDPRVRELLGPPTSPPTPTQGTTRTFERGSMIDKQVVPDAVGTIYVLCGDLQAGTVSHPRGEESFLDIPRLGGPTGGGPGPQPGLYEPGGGFGTVWHENNEVRDCLGYATSPDEAAYPLTWQASERGTILSVPDTWVADILWREDEQWTRIRYAQFALPAR